ncbi:sensor histidine kinase [Alloscardovia macacae]|uniref:Sensor-like histidine kinase SenX3 n=1 Tax=Alloscardovia macacae TaxID=1160091 RepID=A0A261F4P1_9BIFI|nr:HAMP domain-containing sensor histidine kinase [Alloscardovia macacae]OZG54045.1 two-component system sensor histidine kinase [Alloscardovia macacae]
MINRFRIRFVLIAAVAIAIVMILPTAALNYASHWENGRETTTLLRLIDENDGVLPSNLAQLTALGITDTDAQHYQYFSVLRGTDDTVTITRKSNLDYISDAQISAAALAVMRAASTTTQEGTTVIHGQSFSYLMSSDSEGTRLTGMNINPELTSRTRLWNLSLISFFGGLLLFILIATILSRWAIRPFIENYENQKRFITNAGHELKTPLAIISANTELQEMLDGESEWSASTKEQVARMTALINQMVALARLEEQPDMQLTDIDFSDTVQRAASSFKSSVIRDGKTFQLTVAPDIHVKAESKSAFELVNIIVDNANKYCDEDGTVSVMLRRSRDWRYSAHLEVANTYVQGKGRDYSQFFERFYREDESHTRGASGGASASSAQTTSTPETAQPARSGFGIGLNMAQSMVKLFKGRIDVRYSEDTIIFIVRI